MDPFTALKLAELRQHDLAIDADGPGWPPTRDEPAATEPTSTGEGALPAGGSVCAPRLPGPPQRRQRRGPFRSMTSPPSSPRTDPQQSTTTSPGSSGSRPLGAPRHPCCRSWLTRANPTSPASGHSAGLRPNFPTRASTPHTECPTRPTPPESTSRARRNPETDAPFETGDDPAMGHYERSDEDNR